MVISLLIHHLYALFLKLVGGFVKNDVKIFLDLEVVRLLMYYTVDQRFLFSLSISLSFSILLGSLEAEEEEEEWEEG